MRLKILETFEEKFYFRTSHLFWHFLTGIGALVLIGGVLVFLWGLTPSFKPSVKKPVYPEPVTVEANEILQVIKPAPPPKAVTREETDGRESEKVTAAVPAPAAQEDSVKWAYQAAVDSLRSLMPSNKFRWTTRGHWRQTWYRREWVVDALGIKDRLKSAYRKTNASDYVSKQKLLEAYIALVSAFPERHRLKVLRAGIEISKENVYTSVARVALLQEAVPHFSTENPKFAQTLATFGRKNPRDGQAFIEYVNANIARFEPGVREEVLDRLVRSYYAYFNDIDRQKEATDLFLGMMDTIGAEDQAKALSVYYEIYLEKNANRAWQIAQIDARYENDLSHAESVLARKKASKAEFRSLGLKTIGGSIVVIAFMALFLVLLSIQRNVRQLRETSILTVRGNSTHEQESVETVA